MTLLPSVDVLRMIWWLSYQMRDKAFDEGELPGHSRLRIIDEAWTHPQFGKWGTVKQLIQRARRHAETNGYQMIKAAVESLEPHTMMQPRDQLENEGSVYISLTAHWPRVILYEDIQSAALVPGSVWVVGGSNAKTWLGNFGDWPCVNMVLTLRRDTDDAS